MDGYTTGLGGRHSDKLHIKLIITDNYLSTKILQLNLSIT